MGRSDDSQTVGFKYYLGVHMVLAQNKLRVLGLKFGEKIGWLGSAIGGDTIKVDNKELFGGKDAEGGVSGSIDVLDGNPSQPKNAYLSSVIDGTLSAFRGVTSLVFKQFYFGNNPYLKPLAIKVVDEEIGEAWNPSKAFVNLDVALGGTEIYIALDNSGSMAGARTAYMREAVKTFLGSLKGSVNSIRMVAYSYAVQDSITIYDCTDADYTALQAWVDNIAAPNSSTNYGAAVSLADSFFTGDDTLGFVGGGILEDEGPTGATSSAPKTRIIVFLSDGDPSPTTTATDAVNTLAALPVAVDVYCFSIDLVDTTYLEMLDNTLLDGVPVINSSSSGQLVDSLRKPFIEWADMNPVHILRDVLVSETSGGDGSSDLIGDSFLAVADTMYSEGFGLSLLWRNTANRAEFMDSVKTHADLVTYVDRLTGKYEVKAIRGDFNASTLPVYDKTNVSSWNEDIARPRQNELPNQVTVVYTKRQDGSDGSVTATNIAAIQEVGRVIPEKVEYKGITTPELASRVCMRDLSARTVPLLSGSIDILGFAPLDLNLGSPFIVNNPDFGINNVIVRLTSREEVGGSKPKTILTFVEDKFDIDATAIVTPDKPVVTDTSPLNASERLLHEVPYYELVMARTQSDVSSLLSDNPDYGIVSLAGSKPNSFHTVLDTATNNGGGWVLLGSNAFMPTSTLLDDVLLTDTVSVRIASNSGCMQVVAGSVCMIGGEAMRVDDMTISSDGITMTVGRGVLDTVPKKHLAGTSVLFYDGYTLLDPVKYVAGETVEGKFLPKTREGRLPLSKAITEKVLLNSRAIRPYPVGNLKMQGTFSPVGDLPENTQVTWSHRDRTLQVSSSIEDYSYASIGPESGVTYTLEVHAVLDKKDFFGSADVFATVDLFLDDEGSVLIRSEDVEQASAYSYHETAQYDFFGTGDIFDLSVLDIFAPVPINFFARASMFNEEGAPDFFGVVGGNAMRTKIAVIAKRDGYSNWTTATVSGRHFSAPYLLEGEGY